MRKRPTAGLIATTVAAVLSLLLMAPATTATASPPNTTSTRSPTSDATQASTDARTLRRDVASMLQRYITDYGDRFTDAERQKLLAYRADADRKLYALFVTTNRLARSQTAAVSAPERRAAGVAAHAAWKRAKSTADASWSSARQIMEPKLSLFEKVGALRDYDTMMSRFDALGERIDAIAKTSM